MMRPNWVLITVLAGAGAAGLTALILAAEAHGKRRQRRMWLIDRSTT